MSIEESLQVSWSGRLISRLSRALRVLNCRGRRKRKVTPVIGVVHHKGPQAHYSHRHSTSSRKKILVTPPPQSRVSTPPAIKVWSLQEIVAIFRGNVQLRNHFTFQKQLGSGSFSVVCKATHKLTRETVAIKIISKKDLQFQNDIPRIDREMENMSLIDHPHVVKIFQTIHTPEMAFLIMEYCSGGDLFDKIVTQPRIEEEEAKQIFRQVLSAVIHLQKMSIHHRDLKPENILLESPDPPNLIKLIDFNLSVHRKDSASLCSTPCGTIDYAAPEIFKSSPYDPTHSESWSLGILLYTILCAEFPFAPHSRFIDMRQETFPLPPHLSPPARDLICRTLKYNPTERLSPVQMLAHPWLTPPAPTSTTNGGTGDQDKQTHEDIFPTETNPPLLMEEEVGRITGDLMNTGQKEVWRSVESGDRTSPVFCTYSIVSRKKRLLESGEFTSWLNRIQRKTRSSRRLPLAQSELAIALRKTSSARN